MRCLKHQEILLDSNGIYGVIIHESFIICTGILENS